jgi:octaprenyl-diphosphate synthase
MGTVVQLKNQINNSYFHLKDSVEDKLILTEEKIKSKLASDVGLVQKMTDYHIQSGGKRLKGPINSWICETVWLFQRLKRY